MTQVDTTRRSGGNVREIPRVPPHDVEAEESLLGAMLVASSAIEAAEALEPGDFYKPAHGLIFAAIRAVAERATIDDSTNGVDPVTVAHELRQLGVLEEPVGGTGALVALQAATPAIGHAARYARIVAEAARARALIGEMQRGLDAAWAGAAVDAAAHLGAASTIVAELDSGGAALHRSRAMGGGTWILDAPEGIPAVWGEDEAVLWSMGEPLWLCGPAGVGKTTLAQQLVLCRLGLRDDLLGWPVEPSAGRVLYLAMDRPAQAARSFRRMVTEADRALLDDQLTTWKGPLGFSILKNPERLAAMCRTYDATTLIVDSVKDLASNLDSDEPGNKVNAAMQHCVAEGVEVLALHHQRKQQAGGGKPTTLADVYGSTWLTAGAGSVLLVWGEAGDAAVEISHLKQPGADVGPLKVLHDHVTGTTTVEAGFDIVAYLRMRGGATVADVAQARFGRADPTRAQMEKARRQVEAAVRRGVATRVDGRHGDRGQEEPHRYYLLDHREEF